MVAALRLAFGLVVLDCLFDPADALLGMKSYLFVTFFYLCVILALVGREQIRLPIGLLMYVLMFALILPLTSILYLGMFGNTVMGDETFVYFKSFLFLSLVVVFP